MLFYDCYIWIFIAFGFISFAWIMLLVWQIIAKVYVKGNMDSNILKEAIVNRQVGWEADNGRSRRIRPNKNKFNYRNNNQNRKAENKLQIS